MGKYDFIDKKKSTTKSVPTNNTKWGKSKKTKVEKAEVQKIRNLKEIVSLPKKDEILMLLTNAYFNTTSFLEYFVDEIDLQECMMASYSVSQKTIDLFNYHIHKIPKFRLLINSTTLSKSKNFVSQLKELEKNNNFKTLYKRSHTKNLLFTDNKNFYVVVGSGNMTNNTKLESYVLMNNEEMYNFIKKFAFEEA